jgi:hypothetical protein
MEILPPVSNANVLKNITIEEARGLNDGQLIEECKQRVRVADASQRRLNGDAGNLDTVYLEMVVRFRDQNLKGANRDGKPTLKQAFKLAGWNYDAARKFHQRYEAWLKKRLLTDDESPEKLHLSEGDTIKDAAGEYLVKQLSDGDMQATIIKTTENAEETVTVSLYDSDGIPMYEKVPVKKVEVNVGDLVILTDMDGDGAEFRYNGNMTLTRTKTPTVAEQRKSKAQAAKDKKAAAKKRAMKTPLQPQQTVDGKPAPPPTSPDGFVKTETKNSTTKKSKTAKTVIPKVYVASRVRNDIGNDTHDFAVFYETDNAKTTNSAVSSVYKTMKEAEDHRDRLNAKHAKADAAVA